MPLELREESSSERDEQQADEQRDALLERAAKELGVTYEELRSAVEF
ncbi:MAG: hypothetical protein ACT4P4_03220 [Betaproteobacteria bacterium]